MERAQQFHGLTAMGKRNSGWDLNNWKWDGDLFFASQLDHASLKSSSSEPEIERGRSRDLDKKKRVILIDDDEVETDNSSLNPNMEGANCKKAKLAGGSANRAICQVEGCLVDLSNAKDYHRRHKVCETHSKVNKVLIGNVMQRFCQQCSRFHVLEEFDDGKRSCRRRLAGHNKRRRKTLPDRAIEGKHTSGDQANDCVLSNVMRLLSDVHNNSGSNPSIDHDLAAHLLRSLATPSGSPALHDLPGLLRQSQKLLNGTTPEENFGKVLASPSGTPPRPPKPSQTKDGGALNTQNMSSSKQDAVLSVGKTKLKSFDLNDAYIDTDHERVEDVERSPVPGTCGSGSVESSPPQTSGTSGSASTQSPSGSTGEAQYRTDRIVLKLFGREPGEFPTAIRGQFNDMVSGLQRPRGYESESFLPQLTDSGTLKHKVLDWLAQSPTDLESYIRPGCIILTIYLRLPEPIWEELSSDLGSSLCRFFKIAYESFWRSGWIYTRVKNQIVFTCNGQIVVDTSFPSQNSSILCVKPIAVSMSGVAMFQIKGSNLSQNSSRLLCALEGKYLAHEICQDLKTYDDDAMDDDEIECVNLSCSIPSVSGRGFIEVEDQGLSSTFFPFIVTDKDTCSEIRMLESILDSTKLEAKHQAMDFIHEIGWLLHRCQLRSRLGLEDPNAALFSFKRFRWLMEFSMDHGWCAVVRKLLDILLEGNVDYDDHASLGVALAEMGLVHRAVRKSSRALVETLLKYVHVRSPEAFGEEFLFRPDVEGPSGLTPLHIAAGRDGSEAVLDALTDDPRKVGIGAWSSARDGTGATPEDYARLRGHFTYIRLVRRKRAMTQSTGSVVVDVVEDLTTSSLQIAESEPQNPSQGCRACEKKLVHVAARGSRVYRPAMLSMVAVAAVCVCVALLFKSAPVVYILRPFRWDSIDFGSI